MSDARKQSYGHGDNKMTTKALERIEAAEHELAEARRELELEKVGGGNWLLDEFDLHKAYMDGMANYSLDPHMSHFEQGLSAKTTHEVSLVREQRSLYMRFVRAIARENHKLGWVCDWWDGFQEKYFFYIDGKQSIHTSATYEIQIAPYYLYMHEDVIPIIRKEFTDEEIKACLSKGMLI